MKKRKLMLLVLLFLFCGVICSNAEDLGAIRPYASIKVGYVNLSYEEGPVSKSDGGIGLSMALGTTISKYVRVEAEVFKPSNMEASYKYGGVNIDATLETYSVLGNLIFNIPVSEMVDIYFGGGIGSSSVKGKFSYLGSSEETSDNNFTYVLHGGISIRTLELKPVWLDLGIRYMDISGDGYDLNGFFPAIGLRVLF